jgi:hypothetical protein
MNPLIILPFEKEKEKECYIDKGVLNLEKGIRLDLYTAIEFSVAGPYLKILVTNFIEIMGKITIIDEIVDYYDIIQKEISVENDKIIISVRDSDIKQDLIDKCHITNFNKLHTIKTYILDIYNNN